jgi:polar amino acid transport system substrate-binding protein
MRRLRLLSLLAALALAAGLLLAACGDDDDDASAGATDAQTSAAVCTKDTLQTKAAGTLTVATDSPAFPPYVIDDDPANGKGFESAVAYAIADQLGFAQDEVKWVRVPFNSTFAPGPKKYDFDVNQVSINAQRQKGADFSSPYYTTPQGVLVAGDSSFASATTLAELKDAQIGVQVGTTSLDAVNEVIAPSKQPRVYDTSTDVVRALKNGQVDAADIFTTDPSIAANDFVVLEDPKNNFAAQNVLPLINKAKASDTVTNVLNGVSAKLTTQTLIDLLTQVTVDKKDPNAVAKDWLSSQGLV